MQFCLIDFETASASDLKKAGAYVYAADVSTEILCLGYTQGHAEIVMWGRALIYNSERLADKRAGSLEVAVADPDVMFVAHNCTFEKAIWREIMVKQYGWPDIPNDRWHDTQAVCAMKALPQKLDRAAIALRLSQHKDSEGSKITNALSKFDKAGTWDRSPEKLKRVYDYNIQDLKAELELHRRIGGLGAAERKVWLLDQTINERGIGLDLAFVEAAQDIVAQASVPLKAEFAALTTTDDYPRGLTINQRAKVMAWLAWDQNVDIPNMKKETVDKLLGAEDDEDSDEGEDDAADETEDQHAEPEIVLPPKAKRALQIRQVLGSAAVKKLPAMRACIGADGRARGLLAYHAAGPGRWAGRLLQPQNFPRGSLKVDPEIAVAAILLRDSEWIHSLFGEPVSAVAYSLRHALVAAPGKTFVVGDFSTVELRINLALAGQWDKVGLLAAGENAYIPMAELIYKRPVDKHNDVQEYTIGKNTVLGCGFQMGWITFQSRYAPNEPAEFAKGVIKEFRTGYAPRIVEQWSAFENAAVQTVHERRPHEANGVVYDLEDGFLTCRLPSGRKLWYYGPEATRKAMPWNPDDVRPSFRYRCWKKGQWLTRDAYGGLLTENIVQATARDLLVAAMFKCEKAGLPIVLTVHDEIVCEVDENKADVKVLDEIMRDSPPWAKALRIPVATECWSGTRYRK